MSFIVVFTVSSSVHPQAVRATRPLIALIALISQDAGSMGELLASTPKHFLRQTADFVGGSDTWNSGRFIRVYFMSFLLDIATLTCCCGHGKSRLS